MKEPRVENRVKVKGKRLRGKAERVKSAFRADRPSPRAGIDSIIGAEAITRQIRNLTPHPPSLGGKGEQINAPPLEGRGWGGVECQCPAVPPGSRRSRVSPPVSP